MSFLDLFEARFAEGVVRLPGSKSISNRVLLLAALAEGETLIRGTLDSDDTARMLDALEALGVSISRVSGNDYRIRGIGGQRSLHFPVEEADLFLGNAGTVFRPLTAVLSLAGGRYRLSGSPRMHERPIGDLVDALRQLGANITYDGTEGFPPLRIMPADIRPTEVTVRGDVSSQFLTGLLMALPLYASSGEEPLTISVAGELISRPYIEITLALMAHFGVTVEREGWHRFTLPRGQHYRSPGEMRVEGDASSASYFLAAGAIARGPVRVEGIGQGSLQGDVRFADALEQMGARISKGDSWIEARAPESRRLRAIDLDCNAIPDAAMTLAAVALFANGTTRLRNIASWRVKETDRLAAVAHELRKLGASVEEGSDSLTIHPPPMEQFVPHASIDTYDDHRMAMCFSLASFGAPVRINDPGCVSKTFPGYFEKFMAITRAHPISKLIEASPMTEMAENSIPVIAIDGPSASGKGTVALLVAKKLGFHYLDSGSLYRLVALAAMRSEVDLGDEKALSGIAADLDVSFVDQQIRLGCEDVADDIRTEACGNAASRVAAYPQVRSALLERQRAFRERPGLVADGRDMGSMVFPEAMLKVFLTASPEIRAERRYKQLMGKGIDANIATLLQDIRERDARDANRSVAPLQMAGGASLLDTTSLDIQQAVDSVLKLYADACANSASKLS